MIKFDRYNSLNLFAGVLLVFILSACGGGEQSTTSDMQEETIVIMSSTFPVHIVTRNVVNGIEGVEARLLIPGNLGCPHDYSLRPQDMHALARADVLVINGLGMEEFLGRPIERANSELIIVDSSGGIEDLLDYMPSPTAAAEVHDHDHDHDHNHSEEGHTHSHTGVNPHLFASPEMAAKMALSIADQLSEIYPQHAVMLSANAQEYAASLQALAEEMRQEVASHQNVKLVAQHGIFDYLARDIGLEIVAVIQADSGHEASASDLLAVVKRINESGAIAVVAETNYPTDLAETAAREAGVQFAVIDPVSTGAEGVAPDYYVQKMRENVEVLKELLR